MEKDVFASSISGYPILARLSVIRPYTSPKFIDKLSRNKKFE